MEKKFNISGMTCSSCIAKVREVLENNSNISRANVQLNYPQASIESIDIVDLIEINRQLSEKGDYIITEERIENKLSPMPIIEKSSKLPSISISTYKPLILIVLFIGGVSALAQYPLSEFSWMIWMRHFMSGFFIVFSFFKLLNITGFANSYAMYDLLAAKWKKWGYIYPFVELALGIAYFIGFNPYVTNWTTVAVLGFSSLGVIKSNLDNKQIKCACLGDVFNLPMSTVTVIEDLTMVAMATLMLVY